VKANIPDISLSLALARGSQRMWEAPTNHELSNKKFADRQQLFYIM
jgi:hypothetical protein